MYTTHTHTLYTTHTYQSQYQSSNSLVYTPALRQTSDSLVDPFKSSSISCNENFLGQLKNCFPVVP